MSNQDQNAEILIFAGPSGYGSLPDNYEHLPGIKWLPPVRRGEIEVITDLLPPGQLAIVDGLFQQVLAVGHAEIRQALANGWQIWGLSSMGAIRAWEMRQLGMRGFGAVYQWFCQAEEDFRDDEVALLHEAVAPYRATSEPLVHIRVALADLVARQILTTTVADQIITEFANSWFGDRNLTRLKYCLNQHSLPANFNVTTWIASFEQYRIKNQDLANFIQQQPWKTLPQTTA
jgi:hypothetical protein